MTSFLLVKIFQKLKETPSVCSDPGGGGVPDFLTTSLTNGLQNTEGRVQMFPNFKGLGEMGEINDMLVPLATISDSRHRDL